LAHPTEPRDVDTVGLLAQDLRTDLNNGVLDGYLELADPTLITDPALRAALESWPATLSQLGREEERGTRLVDDRILPRIAERGDMAATIRRQRASQFSPEQERAMRILEAAVAEGRNAALRDDAMMRNLAAWRVRTERDILDKHLAVTQRHEVIRGLLQAAIAARR
ncbi:MAG: hypothetical protein KDA22_06410, partial [Phycisphaerales bacterium]|nr:hypothetical protein [Phycisphaerales bacterium]